MSATSPDGRRLHPLSWLFVLLQQLRAFAVPLVVLLVTGRGSSSEWFGLIGVGALTIVSVAHYFAYRYQTDAEGIVIRSGVLLRTRRDIPYERIHTVNLNQTLLHRLFGVTEVRLESAGSKEAEAVMRVLSLADARALEEVIRERSLVRRVDRPTDTEPQADRLLALDTAEVVRLGLISNRGMVVVAVIVGVVWQLTGEGRLGSDNLPDAMAFLRDVGRDVAVQLDRTSLLAAGLLVVLAFLVLVRLLSVALALLQFHGYTLMEAGRQLRVERGLLSRSRNQLPRRRIQAWRIDETLLHRWFGRQTLRVDSAASGDTDSHGVRHLAPVAPPSTIQSLIRRLGPDDAWPPGQWQPLHPRTWRRLFVVPSLMVSVMAVLAVARFGWPGLLLLGAIPLLVARARNLARAAGYAVTPRTIAVCWGWLNRRWGLVEIRKIQALRLTQSPFDRRHGMAALWFDTAGAGASDGVIRIPYLPVEESRALHDRIAATLDAQPPAAPQTPARTS